VRKYLGKGEVLKRRYMNSTYCIAIIVKTLGHYFWSSVLSFGARRFSFPSAHPDFNRETFKSISL